MVGLRDSSIGESAWKPASGTSGSSAAMISVAFMSYQLSAIGLACERLRGGGSRLAARTSPGCYIRDASIFFCSWTMP